MKYALILTFSVLIFFTTALGTKGIKETSMIKENYKRALDSGTDAAAKHTTYLNSLEDFSYGFGEGLEDTLNIPINKDESLKWFYRVFFRNLGVEEGTIAAEQLKSYIPMKCIISFDRLFIADLHDNWIVEEEFILEHNGKDYLFTLSDQVKDLSTDTWLKGSEIGLSTEERQNLVNRFIKVKIEDFVNNRENMESDLYYSINIGLNENDPKFSTINGVSFVVLAEGIPIPSLNIFNPSEKFYAFSIGGSEITREK